MKLRMAAGVAVLLLFLAASPAYAAAGGSHSSSSVLSLGLAGVIADAGHQHYTVSGGALVAGSVEGTFLAPDDSVSFSVNAVVHGLGTSGESSLQISTSGGASVLSAQIAISGELPAAVFPLDMSTSPPSNCSQSCTSEIPAMFTGMATVHLGGDGQAVKVPIAIESPYWNPFGGPIVITSMDNPTAPSIFLVVTYGAASIDWTGVRIVGGLAGTLGAEPVTGFFSQVTNSHEDLVAGFETDSHTISFAGMSDPVLNAKGTFSGTTTFSLAGSFDCASTFGLPEGTCTATGASSAGSFQMVGGQGAKITGAYSTIWSVPSVSTTTVVTGGVVQH